MAVIRMQNVFFSIKIAVIVCRFCLPAFVDRCIFGKCAHEANTAAVCFSPAPVCILLLLLGVQAQLHKTEGERKCTQAEECLLKMPWELSGLQLTLRFEDFSYYSFKALKL